MTLTRRIPMRLTPVPGESLDSWLIAYAHRLDAPIADLLAQSGVDLRTFGTEPRMLARGPSAAALERVAHVTGHSREELEQTFNGLRRYEAGLRSANVSGRSFLPATMRSSRFCPACLADNEGRWQVSWRLPWVVACPNHRVLLATRCPACAALPRRRPIRTDNSPNDPRFCAEPAENATGRNPARCAADLTTVETDAADPRLIELAAAWPRFHDEDRVDDLVRLVGDVAVLLPIVGTGEAVNFMGSALEHPSSFAIPLAAAAEAAMDPSGDTFCRLATARLSRKSPALPAGWSGISPGLAAEALAIRDRHLRPLDRVRWSTTTRGIKPTGGQGDAQDRAARVPASLWPDWTLRLMPTGLETGAVFPTAAATALLLHGSTLATPRLVEFLSDEPTDVRSSARAILEVAKTEHGDTILRCLALLAQALDTDHPSPIDYGRRRRLAATEELLTPRQWRTLCAATGAAPGDTRKRGYARLRLWEILTGGMARQAPSIRASISNDPLSTYYDFARRQTPQFIDALDAHAHTVLDGWGLTDEPLRWSPPLHLLGEVPHHWPGSDHALLSTILTDGALAETRSLGDIAEAHGLDLHQARLVITLGWFAPVPRPGQRYGIALDETLVRDAIETRGLTLRQAAAELGADRKTVSRRCRELSIDLDTPGRRRTWLVDRDWLHQQYVDRGRPLPDIAAEVGCSPANMARIAKENGIPLRSRGGVSHRSATVIDDDMPPLLAACLRGRGGRERVERFAQIAACRSLNQATQLTGAAQSVLSTQLQKLEAAAGGPLMIRSSKGHQPLRVTPLGRKLLKQSTEVLHLPAVTVDPEPLATALRSFRGEERVAKLVEAANEPTLRAAAEACGLTPASLRRSIQGLEASTGRLVRGLTLDESLRLTSKGATLVAQWIGRERLDPMARPQNGQLH